VIEKGTGRFRRQYSSVAGLDKKHPHYAYVRSTVPLLNEFWPGRWQIASVPSHRLKDTKLLALR